MSAHRSPLSLMLYYLAWFHTWQSGNGLAISTDDFWLHGKKKVTLTEDCVDDSHVGLEAKPSLSTECNFGKKTCSPRNIKQNNNPGIPSTASFSFDWSIIHPNEIIAV